MFEKEHFLGALAHETAICQHLFTKLPAGSFDFSLGQNMRTTRELLRYLTCCGEVPAKCLIEDNWEQAHGLLEHATKTPVEEFPAAMEGQLSRLNDLLSPLVETDLKRIASMPWGAQMPLGEALVRTSLQFLTAYRMQLFLHAKAAGNKDLNTHNCWMGQDQPA